MAKALDLAEFLTAPGAILDVRSPGEFIQGRIPGAHGMPLFSNEERAVVGTLYKQTGKKEAIRQGLRFVGPKLADFVCQAEAILKEGYAKVHCWRGGMRSASMAWLLETGGFQTVTLKGGYKAFRRWALAELERPLNLCVIGGMTGSGKTAILQAMQTRGAQVLDLEQLAGHRGSSFGIIGMPPQPSTEQFENEIALQWSRFDPWQPVWVEDESRMIGACKIPDSLYRAMREAPLVMVERPIEERLERLQRDYWKADRQELIDGVRRLGKRLGGAVVREIVELIQVDKLYEATLLLLKYYDTAYCYGMNKRQQKIHPIRSSGLSDDQWSQECMRIALN